MSSYTQKGMKIICKFDDTDWITGLAYEVLDVIKGKIPKLERKWIYKEKYFEVYAFPRNVAILKEAYSKERQMAFILDKESLDECNAFLAQFDDKTKVPAVRLL